MISLLTSNVSGLLSCFMAFLKKSRRTRYRKLPLDSCCVLIYGYISTTHGIACKTPREVLHEFCKLLADVGFLKVKPTFGVADEWITKFAKSKDAPPNIQI